MDGVIIVPVFGEAFQYTGAFLGGILGGILGILGLKPPKPAPPPSPPPPPAPPAPDRSADAERLVDQRDQSAMRHRAMLRRRGRGAAPQSPFSGLGGGG